MKILTPVSLGELYDKISILEIKNENIKNKDKLININNELSMLKDIAIEFPIEDELYSKLKIINEQLWDIEDDIRKQENKQSFSNKFIKLARAVYKTNDIRSEIKKEINLTYDSDFIEEKSYETY